MDFAFTGTTCDSPGGTLHLSPSHVHHMDSLAAVSDIRRSLSRSPSRFQATFTPARPSQPTSSQFHHLPLSIRKMPAGGPPPSSHGLSPPDFTFPSTAKKNRPLFRRNTPHRMLSHTPIKTPAKTPIRRALSDASDHGNASTTPSLGYRGDGQENSSSPEASPGNDYSETMDEPFVKHDHDLSPFNFALTPSRDNISRSTRFSKNSPVKNPDGVMMNLDTTHLGSPGGKRKMVSGGFSSSPFDISHKDAMMVDGATRTQGILENDDEAQSNDLVGSPPPPRLFTLRRSSRIAGIADRPHIRSRRSVDVTLEAGRSPRPYAKTRSRASMDSGIPMSIAAHHDIFTQDETFKPFARNADPIRSVSALSPIAPSPPKEDDVIDKKDDDLFQKPALPKLNFSKSLPIGAVRPKPRSLRGLQDLAQDKEYATPEAYKITKPHPAAFMSTGLISKRHRNVDDMPAPPAHQGMPDTPCKKLPLGFNFQPSPVPTGPTPKLNFLQPSFGTPSKPFNMHSARGTPTTFGKSANIFGSSYSRNPSALERRASFASITSIEGDEPSQSPLQLAHMDSQSSADELPPTPTKHAPHPKPNSLRSKLLGRRPAVNTNTFLPPSAAEQSSLSTSRKSFLVQDRSSPVRTISASAGSSPIFSSMQSLSASLLARNRLQQQARCVVSPSRKKMFSSSCLNPQSPPFAAKTSSPFTVFPLSGSASSVTPHTPAEATFTFPDPSQLSISPRPNTPFLAPGPHHPFHQTPETPTHRDAENNILAQSMNQTPSNHVTIGHDVDADLATKFKKVEWYGKGEFSEVYKVSETAGTIANAHTYFSPAIGQSQRVYIVKKSRSPITSAKIMQKKLREVKAMLEIGSADHIVTVVNHWNANHHLYIQLEFCEEGSLEDFLFKTGRNGRLDDFRIWKILLELCDVSQSNHQLF